MIKTAVQFSGLLRHVKLNHENIKKHLIEPLQADVFCHCWDTQDDSVGCIDATPQEFIDIYKPKDIWIEKPVEKWGEANNNRNKRVNVPGGYKSMLYSLIRSNTLRKMYEKYDLVVRIRTDTELPPDIIEKIDVDKFINRFRVVIPKGNDWGGLNDQIAFMGDLAADLYHSLYSEYPVLIAEGCEDHSEHLFDYLMKKYGIIPERPSIAYKITNPCWVPWEM